MIVWVDLETTGLIHGRDAILEVAMGITDDDLNLMYSVETLVSPFGAGVSQAWHNMESVVLEMHTKSGLIGRIVEAERNGTLKSIYEVEVKLCNFILDYHAEQSVLAGSSVHFDRQMLLSWMPQVVDLLHYRNIDVSSFKEVFKRWYPKTSALRPQLSDAEKPHKAMEDLQNSIEELKWYRRFILRGPTHIDEHLAGYVKNYQDQQAQFK